MNHVEKFAALGAAAALFVLAGPAFAQNGGARGMSAGHSTPADQVQTRALNEAIVNANRAADAKAAAEQQHYQAQRAEYSEQQARYHDAMGRHARQQDAYEASRNAYGLQRARYNTALVHHRHDWPGSKKWAMVGAASHPVGLGVRFLDGTSAGTISAVAHGPGGQTEALLLQLRNGGEAWIEGTDLRFDAGGETGGVLMTNLDARDIQAMTSHNTAAMAGPKSR